MKTIIKTRVRFGYRENYKGISSKSGSKRSKTEEKKSQKESFIKNIGLIKKKMVYINEINTIEYFRKYY